MQFTLLKKSLLENKRKNKADKTPPPQVAICGKHFDPDRPKRHVCDLYNTYVGAYEKLV